MEITSWGCLEDEIRSLGAGCSVFHSELCGYLVCKDLLSRIKQLVLIFGEYLRMTEGRRKMVEIISNARK